MGSSRYNDLRKQAIRTINLPSIIEQLVNTIIKSQYQLLLWAMWLTVCLMPLQTCPHACYVFVWLVRCIVKRSVQTWQMFPPCQKRLPTCMPASTRLKRFTQKILQTLVSPKILLQALPITECSTISTKNLALSVKSIQLCLKTGHIFQLQFQFQFSL